LFRFIDWVMELPPTLALEYTMQVELFEEEKKMQYVTSVERIGIEKGIQQGRAHSLETPITTPIW
jgi:hypothetical protein